MTTVAEPQIWETEDLLNGCQAVAEGIRLCDVDVIAAYPIRPYTEVMDILSRMIANGQLDSEYIVADSEHSQFEIVKHASSVGARAFGGSSGTGWMYGMEALAVTASDRLPTLFLVGNRALDDPGAFGVEHNDALAVRDLGWLTFWVATAQEALEHVFLAYRIAEDKRVRMPVCLAMDGAFLTHSQHMIKIPTQASVKKFLPPYDLDDRKLHPDHPVSIAPQANEDWVMELRRQNWEASNRSRLVIPEAYKEFNAIFGNRYANPWFDEYMTEDADTVLIGMGTVNQPGRTAVRRLREQGHKVGYINLRWFRPFPAAELRAVLGRFKAVGVIDRDVAMGSPDNCGVLMHEVRSALYPLTTRPAVVNYITGLGGRDVAIQDINRMFDIAFQARDGKNPDVITWVGVRE